MNFMEKSVAGISLRSNSSLSFIASKVVQHKDKDGREEGGVVVVVVII